MCSAFFFFFFYNLLFFLTYCAFQQTPQIVESLDSLFLFVIDQWLGRA